MAELDDLAEAVSDMLAKKEELRPLGKEIVEELEPEQRKSSTKPFRRWPSMCWETSRWRF